MNALRKVHHRGIQITLDNVKCLWQELDAFETKLEPNNSKNHTYNSNTQFTSLMFRGRRLISGDKIIVTRVVVLS